MKITVISDTHNFEPTLPGGDLLIHAGDLTKYGFSSEVIKQLNFLHENLDKYKDVLVIPGNHDLWAERHLDQFKEACMLGGLITLVQEDTLIQGLKFWAAPHTPRYQDWAFNRDDYQLFDLWETIPEDIDFLVTHGPPRGILDLNRQGIRIGCQRLADRLLQIKPLIHAFGHCHESNGVEQKNGITFINAAKTIINIKLDKETRTVKLV